ncbi:hypothetical protein O181_012873 [Austropuccinia psidii MF-1]|uniref:Uncharacterized protein n=1 Tax=Austropuccinia psidii MF-1 TaxID=1389203 RepID=A0A9Q3BY53_9BASI|nr:hypothetical protein [Austropuccinia psidii MF-1]
MKDQSQSHVMDNPYQPDDIKPDSMLVNSARSPSQYKDGDNMSYYQKEALKQLPQASSWPKFSGTGEYDHMELKEYVDGLYIDVPSIPDYWITVRLNTAFKGHASIWFTEMKEIHARRNWPWWKSQIIQKYSNGTWIWQKTMSFENDKYSVDKDPYEWRTTELSKRSSSPKEKQPFRVQFKEKPKGRVEKVTKNHNSCHNCGSTDDYGNNYPKAKNKVYAFGKFPQEESSTEDSDTDSMGDAIREQSDEEQNPREEFLVEYKEETPLEIQDIQLEAGMPQDTPNRNL